jgi:hypothetical protein
MPYPSVTNSLLSVSRYAPAVPPCAPVKKPGDIITRKGMTRAARAAGAVAALGALGAAVPANASLHATGSGAAPPAQLRASCPVTAYIADVYGGVTPINTATNTAGPAITVGTAANYGPGAIAITPNRKTAYVLDESAGGNPGNDSIVTPISTATGKAGRPIPVGTRPTPAPRKAPARPGIPPARPAPAPAGLRGTRPRLPRCCRFSGGSRDVARRCGTPASESFCNASLGCRARPRCCFDASSRSAGRLMQHLLRSHGRISGILTCADAQFACYVRFALQENSRHRAELVIS